MHRLFVALRPPAAIRALLAAAMGGVPEARWQHDDQLHLTLRFIGEVAAHHAEDIAAVVAGVTAAAITARIAGVDGFERRGRYDTLWAGVAPREPPTALHARLDRALVSAGVAPDTRAYLPHVTLARLPRSAGAAPQVERWLADHAALATHDFALDRLILFESHPGRGGAHYREVLRVPLR